MFDTKKKIAVMAMLTMMAAIPLQTASAASYGHNSGLNISFGHNGGHLSYGHNRGHKRHHGGAHRSGHSGHGIGYGNRNYGHSNYGYAKRGHSNYGHSNQGHNKYSGANTGYRGGHNCRDTYKHQTDHNGKLTKIKGTLCYDSYGKAYIVPGSRYVDSTYH